jgi:Fur family ferric uptake transcriptional regulator
MIQSGIDKKTRSEKKPNEFDWFWLKLDAYLKSQDLKQTKQRRLIIEYFIGLNTHVGAELLHATVRQAGYKIGLATIYRTLNLLREAGLVEQHNFSDGRSVFEIDHPGTHHDHLVCLTCGAVIEFENDAIEQMQNDIAAKYGFDLRSHRHDLYGDCVKPDCKKKNISLSD